jgi:hypothetical protein
MLSGRRFMLRSPTVAVEAHRIIVTIPIGEIVVVTSDTGFEPGMIEVTWQDRKLTLFESDLVECGEENFQAEPVHQSPESIDGQQIRQLLQEEVDAAQQRRIAASKHFSEVIGDVPSGLPHPDGTDRIRLASREYSASRHAASEAMERLSDFMTQGIIPADLKRKPMKREPGGDSAKKSGS